MQLGLFTINLIPLHVHFTITDDMGSMTNLYSIRGNLSHGCGHTEGSHSEVIGDCLRDQVKVCKGVTLIEANISEGMDVVPGRRISSVCSYSYFIVVDDLMSSYLTVNVLHH